MQVAPTASTQPAEAVQAPLVVPPSAAHSPILITENEVVFSTAAATAVAPAKSAPRWVTAIRHMFAKTAEQAAQDDVRKARHYPRRNQFLEANCMARGMDRL